VLAVLYRKILAEEMAAERPPEELSRSAPGVPFLPGSQAPAPPADFTGRLDELASVIDFLTGTPIPVAVLFGCPGIGKTAAAAAIASRLRPEFPDGQLYVELGGIERPRDPQGALHELLQSLGLPVSRIPPPGPARGALYRSLLAGRKVLLIADDAATAAQVRPLIPAPGGAAVLVTSRARLSGLAGARAVEVGSLPAADSLTLLRATAGPDRVVAEPVAAATIAAACAGSPLAVRLAGATLAARPGLSLATFSRELAGAGLLGLVADDLSLRETIASSFRAVPAPAAAALSAVARLVPGEIPAWTLAAVGGGDTAIAGRLAAAGLLSPATAEIAGARYRLHPLIRAYAADGSPGELADDDGFAESLLDGWRLRAGQAAGQLPSQPFLPHLPVAASPAGPGLHPGRPWLGLERENLVAAVLDACARGRLPQAAELALILLAGQCGTSDCAAASEAWRAIAAAAADAGDSAGQARAHYFLAVARSDGPDHGHEAAELLATCAPALSLAGDPDLAAMSYGLLGRCASAEGRHAIALRSLRQARALAASGPAGARARCCLDMVTGLTLARIGLCDSGPAQCRKALAAAQALGEPAYAVQAAKALAQALMLAGQYQAAADVCSDAVVIARGVGATVTAARLMLVLGRACQFAGNRALAHDSLHAAAEAFRAAGLVVEEVTARSMLASASGSAGDSGQESAQVREVSDILARRGIKDAAAKAAAAQAACQSLSG
jgi:hypothetical protein